VQQEEEEDVWFQKEKLFKVKIKHRYNIIYRVIDYIPPPSS
jgi:hypothetical protein